MLVIRYLITLVSESSIFLELTLVFSNYPANTGIPNVAVLINAPAKIRKGSKGYFSIMRCLDRFTL